MTKERETFSIGDTAKMTGASQKQIRNWEAKYYISTADRLVCGERSFRRYNIEQVETIRLIKENLDAGFTLKAAVEKATGTNLTRKEVINNA